MGDMTCGPSSNAYFTPAEPLVCEAPPEPLVCEAPPPPPPPKPKPPKDHVTRTASSGKSSASFGFLDESAQVCRAPESHERQSHWPRAKELPASSDMVSVALDSSLFTSTLDNSSIVASMDLELTDKDGLQNRSRNDIEGVVHKGTVSVNRELFTPGLDALKGTTKVNGDTTTKIKNVGFDARTQSYYLDLEVTKKLWKVPVWDNFRVQLKANDKGEMVAELSENWFPDKKILDQLEKTVRDTLKSKVPANLQAIRLETEQKDNQLILRPQLKSLEVPIGAGAGITLTEMDSRQAKLRLDQKGHLHVDLKNVKVSGSTGTAESTPAATPDKARLQVQIGLGKDGSRQTLTNGNVQVRLDESETPNIKMGHDRLSDFVRSGTIEGDLSLYTKREPGKQPEVQSRSQVRLKDADLGNGQKATLETSLKLDFDSANGIRLDTLDHDYQPLKINTSQNGVEFMVNGAEYYPEMKRLIAGAKESVALETYMFTNDAFGREIADLLARKAAGLDLHSTAPKLGKDTSHGVDIRFIFNSWKGNEHDGHASEEMLRQARAKVAEQIDNSAMSPAQKAQAKANLEKNLNWKFFTEGILRSDHRKVLVVDGAQATVGGMNLGQHYLSENGYHDAMVKLAGPEVRNIHREFLENWYEFRKEEPPEGWQSQLKSRRDLERSLEQLRAQGQYRSQAGVQTLVTDDRQIDIERGMIDLIDKAETELNIEQAFFSDETILKHLGEAMKKRKLKVNVIVAADPLAASVFKPANLLSAYELAKIQKAGAPGQVTLHYYTHEQGGERNHIHAKAISADGKRAIIGSANMIGRSLSSPFVRRDADGKLSQAMYNKEMSLLLEGRQFVQEIDERLFYDDMNRRTKAMDADAIIKAVQDAGGEAELRKKAVAAPFT